MALVWNRIDVHVYFPEQYTFTHKNLNEPRQLFGPLISHMEAYVSDPSLWESPKSVSVFKKSTDTSVVTKVRSSAQKKFVNEQETVKHLKSENSRLLQEIQRLQAQSHSGPQNPNASPDTGSLEQFLDV
eukprot:CAMPEP_0194523908 /NCGR_PEP_ID=MMETSP0253-20130528/58925_1 /TAXON_ID=2966 /ORGANISM="Noctiluca scintillans" /LENGTH=128 /DNA_ID=CAMNT_0039368487 /DNA_START=126 /DNA_END=512 /DNA_ORIENTATION=-